MAKFTFRCVAMHESHSWGVLDVEPLLQGMSAFGVYLFEEGVATHICSLQASARADFIGNEFIPTNGDTLPIRYDDLSESEQERLEELERNDGGEAGTYFDYHAVHGKDKRLLSKRISVNRDVRDFYETGKGWRAARDAAREAAWEGVMEDIRCNRRPSIPVLDGDHVWRDWQREQAPRVIPTLPLFAHASA